MSMQYEESDNRPDWTENIFENGMFIGEVEDIILDIDSKRIDSLAVGKLNPEVMELKTHRGENPVPVGQEYI
jgi:sporulation protein YlmC with PRC-barrel domain